MGTGINIGCGNCKYNQSFMLGTGKYYVLIENCLEALPEKSAEEIKALIDKKVVEDFTFAYKLFQCDRCTLLFDHGDLKIDFAGEKPYFNPVECPSCENDIRSKVQAKKDIEDLTCPTCSKEGQLKLESQMDWA